MTRDNAQGYCPVDGHYVTVALTYDRGRLIGTCPACSNTFNATDVDPEFGAIVVLDEKPLED